MAPPNEGYIFHTYGADCYLKHAIASVHTLRRYDQTRPVALFCTPRHHERLREWKLTGQFQVVEVLPAEHRSIVGFKHALHRFKAFGRSLFVDADMIWCRNPDPLWRQLSAFPFTATGLQCADHFFGGPKGIGVVADIVLQRRARTLRRFGLTHLPRVQAGMIYAQDRALTEAVSERATYYLTQVDRTHFRSRLEEGRTEESCEWSLAMAMSERDLAVFPWLQGQNSPQLDYIDSLTAHDADFIDVRCRYYTVPFVYNFRGLPVRWIRDTVLRIADGLPRLGDSMDVTPYALHFGWLHQKQTFYDFAERIWTDLLSDAVAPVSESSTVPPYSSSAETVGGD